MKKQSVWDQLRNRGAKAIALRGRLLIGLVVLATWLPTQFTGGPTRDTWLVMAGLGAVVVMWLINSQRTDESQSRAKLARLNLELGRQNEFLGDLAPMEDLQSCLNYIVQATAETLRCRRVSLMLADKTGQCLRIAASHGVPAEVVKETEIRIGEGIAGLVFQQHKAIHADDAKSLRGDSTLPIDSSAFLSGPLLLSGMRWGNALLGVLSVTSPAGRKAFDVDDEFAFTNICAASAVAIYNHVILEKRQQDQVAFLETLVNTIEARDPYTSGHTERVAKYAQVIGEQLNLDRAELAHLGAAARLHDIGKLGIPDAILHKDGLLTDKERGAIQKHATIGARILQESRLEAPIVAAIRYHHERNDGTGYRIEYDAAAVAYTEAPDNLACFFRQRFRWMFGTFQVAVKHLPALFNWRHPCLGFIGMPNMLLFQVFYPLLAPLMDFVVLCSVALIAYAQFRHIPIQTMGGLRFAIYYALFLAMDMASAALAFVLERNDNPRLLLWVPVQRVFYRMVMYYTGLKSLLAALGGRAVGWGTLQRKATMATVRFDPVLVPRPLSQHGHPHPDPHLASQPDQRRFGQSGTFGVGGR